MDKITFNRDIASVLGISPDDVVDIYGFTEQMGLITQIVKQDGNIFMPILT